WLVSRASRFSVTRPSFIGSPRPAGTRSQTRLACGYGSPCGPATACGSHYHRRLAGGRQRRDARRHGPLTPPHRHGPVGPGLPASILSDSYAVTPSGRAPPPTSASHTRGPCGAAHATQTSRPPVSPPPVARRTVVPSSVVAMLDHAGAGGRTPVSRSMATGASGPRSISSAVSSDASVNDAFSEKR